MTVEEARIQASQIFADADPIGESDSLPQVVQDLGRGHPADEVLAPFLEGTSPGGFPIPELLLYGLTSLVGLPAYGPEEKLRWGVDFRFRGTYFAFEFRKFGLRARCETAASPSLIREVLGRARSLTDVAEKHLRDELGPSQIANGRATIENLYPRLRFRYQYLRSLSEDAFATCTKPSFLGSQEGSALGTATVDAYFSVLEHLLALQLGFMADLGEGGVLQFLGSNWPAKAKRILDLTDPQVKVLYDRLRNLREEWRNPLAHGGFLSGGASLYFHVNGIGALPALLRKTPDGIRLGLRMTAEPFKASMELFDAFDEYLASGPLRFVLKWASAGLDVSLAPESREQYRAAIQSDAFFDEFLHGSAQLADMHDNMDY